MRTLRDAFAFVWNCAVIWAVVAGAVVGRILSRLPGEHHRSPLREDDPYGLHSSAENYAVSKIAAEFPSQASEC